MKWLATAAVEVEAVAGEAVAVAVAVDVAVVVVSESTRETVTPKLTLTGWSGGNNAPIRNNRW